MQLKGLGVHTIIWDGITQAKTIHAEAAQTRHALASAASAAMASRTGVADPTSPVGKLFATRRICLVRSAAPGCLARRSLRHRTAVPWSRRLAHPPERAGRTSCRRRRSARPPTSDRRADPCVQAPRASGSATDSPGAIPHGYPRSSETTDLRSTSSACPSWSHCWNWTGQRCGSPYRGCTVGSSYWLETDGVEPRLIAESWCRVVGGSGQRHEVTPSGSQLLEEGFV